MTFDTLVLSGGGKKGFAHLGALNVGESTGYLSLSKITLFVGCSVGSYICACLACGVSLHTVSVDMLEGASPLQSSSLYDSLKFKEGSSLVGILDTSLLIDFVTKMFSKYGVPPSITFLGIREKYGRSLVVCVTNITTGQPNYFSADSHPDMELVKAVSMSCCIPGIFRPVMYDECVYCDGGLCDNLPLSCVPRERRVFAIALEEQISLDSEDYVSTALRMMLIPIYRIQDLTICMSDKERVTVLRIVFSRQVNLSLRITQSDRKLYLHGCRYMFRFIANPLYYTDDSVQMWD